MDRQERIKYLQQELQKEPSDIFLNYALGLEYAAQPGTFYEAEAQYRKVLKLDNKYLAGYYQLGQLYELQNRSSEALTYYREGLATAREKKDLKSAGEFQEVISNLEE